MFNITSTFIDNLLRILGLSNARKHISFLGSYLLVTIAMFSIGILLASVAPNIKTANVLCSLVYFPMLLFSGATIPYELMSKTAQIIMDFLPLTQGVKLMKATSLGLPLSNVAFSVAVLIVVSIICYAISLKFFKWE